MCKKIIKNIHKHKLKKIHSLTISNISCLSSGGKTEESFLPEVIKEGFKEEVELILCFERIAKAEMSEEKTEVFPISEIG